MANVTELTAASVMDTAAALMNDQAKQQFTYDVQLEYLNMAARDLQEIFEQNEVPVVATGSVIIPVDAGVDHIAYADSGATRLPDDMISPSVVWERQRNINPFTLMTPLDFLDLSLSGQEINQFIWYVWQSQEIQFFKANQDNDIKIDYIKNLFMTITDPTDNISVINAHSYLSYRTARHLAIFVAENPSRGQTLEINATQASDILLSIGTKGRQKIVTRRRPFRSGYKRGGILY